MHHAIPAKPVLARFPVGPIDAIPKLVPRRIVLLTDEVTRTFPSLRRSSDCAPWRAVVISHPRREFQIHRRGHQTILSGKLKYALELCLYFTLREEDVSIDGFVMVSGRDHHPVNAQLRDQLAKVLDLSHLRLFEDGRIGGYVISEPLRFFDHIDGFVENACSIANKIISFLHAIEVNVDGQPLVWSNLPEEIFVQQQCVGAEVNMPLAVDDAFEQLF